MCAHFASALCPFASHLARPATSMHLQPRLHACILAGTARLYRCPGESACRRARAALPTAASDRHTPVERHDNRTHATWVGRVHVPSAGTASTGGKRIMAAARAGAGRRRSKHAHGRQGHGRQRDVEAVAKVWLPVAMVEIRQGPPGQRLARHMRSGKAGC